MQIDPCYVKKCIPGWWLDDARMSFVVFAFLNLCSNVIAKVVCSISSGLSYVREASLGVKGQNFLD